MELFHPFTVYIQPLLPLNLHVSVISRDQGALTLYLVICQVGGN